MLTWKKILGVGGVQWRADKSVMAGCGGKSMEKMLPWKCGIIATELRFDSFVSHVYDDPQRRLR